MHRGHDNGELVTPEARDRVRFSRAMAQSVGNHFQELVADGMAKRIIDALEVIEIEAEDGEAFAPLHSLELVLDALAQQDAIGQIGQGICRAMCAICASARCRSVMSSWVASHPPSAMGLLMIDMTRPSASCVVVTVVFPRATFFKRSTTYSSGSPSNVPAAARR